MGTGISKPAFTGGFHVLGIQPDSPASEALLEPLFDYIVGIASVDLIHTPQPENELVTQLRKHLHQPVELLIFNTRNCEIRSVSIVPSNNWGGTGLLGARIRFCRPSPSGLPTWRVLSVEPGSPAHAAGLEADTDFIVSSPDVLLRDDRSLSELIASLRDGAVLRLIIYSSARRAFRSVVINIRKDWGGTGKLGCDIASGTLHRIPADTDADDTDAGPMGPSYQASRAAFEQGRGVRSSPPPAGVPVESNPPPAPEPGAPIPSPSPATSETAMPVVMPPPVPGPAPDAEAPAATSPAPPTEAARPSAAVSPMFMAPPPPPPEVVSS
ncbi:hypothetical protein H696_03887 [Fonticula alba]|uniref:PDZ GRASP-type domain-containing protein n=1 Tax=Fonticula alba TaxID=691883 RepID=A0A058Z6E1_FONAL|nr:hypothetical protein H696_03887 [Fonticula alba]KCV69458.1 hypothetical protein H696_03887 [Fonticula alba]|eukprot:XP_009496023.1 hypothetical protein H696_03887 [Fonticula alba]